MGLADHFVTGGAGFMGGHLLAALVGRSDAGRIHALARSSNEASAHARVLATLGDRGAAAGERLRVFDGDVTRADCGLGGADIEQAARGGLPLVFWHLAASLRWEAGRRQSVFEANVDGTRNAMALARRVGADLFVHVSTAYTCGSIEGDIPEAIHSPPAFNNVYEESKGAAERYVVSQGEGGPRGLILRPSIIVGSSQTYAPAGSYTGLYGMLSELRRFKKMLGDSQEVVRLSAKPSAVLSFIPIDHVIQDALAAVDGELREPTRQIYHLTSDGGPNIGEQIDHIFSRLGLGGQIELVDGAIDGKTPLERFFARRMEFFSGYLRSTKRFARSIATPRSVSLADMKRYIDRELGADSHDHE